MNAIGRAVVLASFVVSLGAMGSPPVSPDVNPPAPPLAQVMPNPFQGGVNQHAILRLNLPGTVIGAEVNGQPTAFIQLASDVVRIAVPVPATDPVLIGVTRDDGTGEFGTVPVDDGTTIDPVASALTLSTELLSVLNLLRSRGVLSTAASQSLISMLENQIIPKLQSGQTQQAANLVGEGFRLGLLARVSSGQATAEAMLVPLEMVQRIAAFLLVDEPHVVGTRIDQFQGPASQIGRSAAFTRGHVRHLNRFVAAYLPSSVIGSPNAMAETVEGCAGAGGNIGTLFTWLRETMFSGTESLDTPDRKVAIDTAPDLTYFGAGIATVPNVAGTVPGGAFGHEWNLNDDSHAVSVTMLGGGAPPFVSWTVTAMKAHAFATFGPPGGCSLDTPDHVKP